ncbi:hypothetical protein ACFSJS_16995 [Streptomyces desertarenae]|uniref:Uncharacterized protein n=1 Tax=Streptomyces desertarenae TaxID=2666184 RepID=A0ABW4PKU8_9ACTN
MTEAAPTGVPAGTVIGLDAGLGGLHEADHLLLALAGQLPEVAFACTHRVPEAPGRIVLSLALPDAVAAETALDRLAASGGSPASLLPPGTHAVLGDRRLPLPGGADGRPAATEGWGAARAAAAECAARTGGRAVVFPGSADLPAVLAVGEVPERSAITAVEVLGGTPVDPAAALDTRNHLRPEWRDGALLLKLVPARGGYLPFDLPDPHPCCAAHG